MLALGAVAQDPILNATLNLQEQFRRNPSRFIPPGIRPGQQQFVTPTEFVSPGASCNSPVDFKQGKIPIVAMVRYSILYIPQY